MYYSNNKKTITIELVLEYEYESDMEEIKELIKQIIDLKSKNVKTINYKKEG